MIVGMILRLLGKRIASSCSLTIERPQHTTARGATVDDGDMLGGIYSQARRLAMGLGMMILIFVAVVFVVLLCVGLVVDRRDRARRSGGYYRKERRSAGDYRGTDIHSGADYKNTGGGGDSIG